MRVGALYEWTGNTRYRSFNPMEALRRRSHEVLLTRQSDGDVTTKRLGRCDVIHGYRLIDGAEFAVVQQLIARGAAFVWDTDDDLASLPRESPRYRETGGLNAQRIFARTVQFAKQADVVTVTTEALAGRYRAAGVERIALLGNYLDPEVIGSRRRTHDGIVIGWVAGREHGSELPRIPILHALTRLMDAYPQVRVASLGLNLALRSERYDYRDHIHIRRLQEHIGAWDIGIAPLADIPFNRTRSDVKLKEYAAAGLPWLASPIGPYKGYGEAEGGRLVPDNGWYEALEDLITQRFRRVLLSRRARAWAKQQSIDRHVQGWEDVLREAIERRGARGQAAVARRASR